MKNQKKMTITTAVLTLAFSFIAAGGATFAWFTRGTTATASGFDFTASAASGIQISTDPTNTSGWQSSISNLDFDTLTPGAAQEGNRVNLSSMEPVSTIDGAGNLVNGEFVFYGATSGDGTYTIAEDTNNYLVFDLYFRNQGSLPLTLSLTNSSFVIAGANDESTQLSTRVGFVVEGSENDPTAAVALASGASTYIWEPNSTQHSLAALAAGVTNNAKYNYHGVKAIPSTGGVASSIDSYGHLSSNAEYTELVSTTNDVLIGDSGVITVLPAGGIAQITKIKVFVWMEGQDVDSNNAASEGDVQISLAFDSGAQGTELEAKTASVLTTATGTTTLSLTGNDDTGVTFYAYVFQTGTDANTSVDYRLYLSTGSATDVGTGVSSITLDTEVALGTYDVVVVGKLTGAITSRVASTGIVNS